MIPSDNIYKPKVSIIIPVYNVKQYLSEALDSVINQTYKNLEIIVVDDGSNDGSEIICEEYAKKDNRIKLIHRENGGLSAARNTGLDNMTGEYVAFLDSDDVFVLNAIEKSLNAMLFNNVDCVAFKYTFYKNTNNVKFYSKSKNRIISTIPKGVYSRNEALRAIVNQKLDVNVWSKLTKKKHWNDIRFPEGHVYEDLYIVCQLFEKFENIYVENDILTLYRKRKQSITSTNSIKNIKDLFDSRYVFEKYIEEHTPEIFDIEQLQKIRKYILTDLIMRYAKNSPKYFTKSEIINFMKEKIEEWEKVVKIKNCKTEIKLIYYMIFNHPIFLSIFYYPCRITYRIIRNIV